MTNFSRVCVGIGEHYAIVLMGNFICIYSENVNGVMLMIVSGVLDCR